MIYYCLIIVIYLVSEVWRQSRQYVRTTSYRDFADSRANYQVNWEHEIFENHKTLQTINFILMGRKVLGNFATYFVCCEHFIKHLFA